MCKLVLVCNHLPQVIIVVTENSHFLFHLFGVSLSLLLVMMTYRNETTLVKGGGNTSYVSLQEQVRSLLMMMLMMRMWHMKMESLRESTGTLVLK